MRRKAVGNLIKSKEIWKQLFSLKIFGGKQRCSFWLEKHILAKNICDFNLALN